MRKLIIFAIVGFFAQLIDGALGMAYGLTSTSLLLAFNIAPAVASASVHMSEVATTLVSGISHYRFGNVDKKLAIKLAIPGSISAFIGAAFLSSLPGNLIKPYISFFLVLMGVYILFRFLFKWNPSQEFDGEETQNSKSWYLIPLGAIAGFLDAVGGGGWGPINTPTLLSRKGAIPRKVIGTVDASEFAIAVSATLGFLLFLGSEHFNWVWVGAFVIGGVIAAPIAAYLVSVVPSYLLGVIVGGFIILTNVRTLLNSFGISPDIILFTYAILGLGWILAIAWSNRHNKLKLNVNSESA